MHESDSGNNTRKYGKARLAEVNPFAQATSECLLQDLHVQVVLSDALAQRVRDLVAISLRLDGVSADQSI